MRTLVLKSFSLAAVHCIFWGIAFLHVAVGQDEERRIEQQSVFFESKIRPLLVTHCLECHAADTETSGGLLLDSSAGWKAGGDSGSVIEPGRPENSRLLKAIRYEIPKLQMPPTGRLKDAEIALIEQWIREGAYDPRNGEVANKASSALTVERALEHWSYRPLTASSIQKLGNVGVAPAHPVDQLIDARLSEMELHPAPRAPTVALTRRLYFDLIGLPPTASELQDLQDAAGNWKRPLEDIVDQLMSSPQFGEHFARKWLDVVRYAESVTLRGFVLPQAWRYRDYIVQAYTQDRPFDQMIREQIAGDLLRHENADQRRQQLIATGFLALGNTNLEEQDKTQLEMDYIDEQLDVMGSAFLGQTIGCARCHNHKFDPIPTRDYYALAGIMRSAVALEHENVSKWVEQPLPESPEQGTKYAKLAKQLVAVTAEISSLKKEIGKDPKEPKGRIPLESLPGIVVDSSKAKLVGAWSVSASVSPVVGDGYIHDANTDKGQKTATFEPPAIAPGTYDVRFAYAPFGNRATNAKVRVFSADGEATVIVNEQSPAPEDGLWISLGQYRFEKDGQAFVMITNEDSNGVVIADAIQFLPVDGNVAMPKPQPTDLATASADTGTEVRPMVSKSRAAAIEKEIKALESRKKKLEAELATQPKYLTVIEKGPAKDIPVHIRGDVHILGEVVPRGFLTAIGPTMQASLPAGPSRVELADWIASPRNPLTARVYANRVWAWLMGQGIVASTNNFGTTGAQPTHPELLDWLANELVESGWSTKHLVRIIVTSQAYQRAIVEPSSRAREVDPSNSLYWRGAFKRLPVESLRDAMLSVSGELDLTLGGSLIREGTKADYNYEHASTRRSIYHPLFRNSLPELMEVFDFADSSMSIGQRPRTTVAPQALALHNSPWVMDRAKAAAERYKSLNSTDPNVLLTTLYLDILGRLPTASERTACAQFMSNDGGDSIRRLALLIQSLFASIDFRYLD
jgi:mono/diheme cytochrome c family protein